MDYKHYTQVFWRQVEKYGDRPAYYDKIDGQWIATSWKSFGDKVMMAAKAMFESGIKEQDTVGIFSQNCPEWSIADFAALCNRAVPTPVYATDAAGQAKYILDDAEAKIVFVGDKDQYDKVMSFLKKSEHLQKVIVFNEKLPIEKSDKVMYLSDFLEIGAGSGAESAVKERMARGDKNDLLTLIYTSGTTGEPKGVMLTHYNMLFQADAHEKRILPIGENDVSLCFLPLSHVFERCWTYMVYYKGAVNYYLRNPAQVIDIIKEVKPTVMCAVPRFYEKIHAAVFEQLERSSPTKKKLFNWAVDVGAQYNTLKKDRQPVSGLLQFKYKAADKLVLSKIREVTGGRIRFFPCAGAPLSQNIEEFFGNIGVFICYGYGLTETTATATCHEPHNYKYGTVGLPMPSVEIKIEPKTNEILIRGGNIMKGYYKKPQATADVFTEDGYFRTGDAGEFDENGELRITERIKELMKTSGGKYIAPQLIETLVGSNFYVEQVSIIGDQKKYVTALIVPNFVALEEYAQKNNISYSSREELVTLPEIYDFYQNITDKACSDLAGYQKIKYFKLLAEEFTVDSGEITPTLKLKRGVISKKYKGVIDSMYED